MLQKIKNKFLAVAALSLLTTVGLTGVVAAQPQPQGALCKGANTLQLDEGNTASASDCTNSETGTVSGLNGLITQIINIFSIIVGIIAVIMIIWGGLKYITSGGDSGNVTGAKNTILYAIIGLVIVALAQFIVRFVLGKASGAVDNS